MNESTASLLDDRKARIEDRLQGDDLLPQGYGKPVLQGSNIHYEISARDRGVAIGGIGAMHLMAQRLELAKEIDSRLGILKLYLPYRDSDHVLNITYNALSGGTCLDDLELLRNDEGYLDVVGAQRIPDPTTAGDFCRRFGAGHINALMDGINEVRLRVWERQPRKFFEEAFIDGDGTMVPTSGQCKEGIALSYDGQWGYHALVISLANTQEPLFIVNRSGNRPSQEGAAEYFDRAVTLVRRAGFKEVTLRGDTDFSQSEHLDRWDAGGVRFVFGYDAMKNMTTIASSLPSSAWKLLIREPKYELATEPRERPENVRDRIVSEREYKNLHLLKEEVTEFDYQPTKCNKSYRMVVLKKTISVECGQLVLYPEVRYFFYITNRRDISITEVVRLANDRCNQENLHAQLKGGVRALRAPLNTLLSNWAYMVMTALAWSMKAWFALLLPVDGQGRGRREQEHEKRALLRMEFRTFLNAIIRIPAQIIRTGRRTVVRLMGWNRWLPTFFRGIDALRVRHH